MFEVFDRLPKPAVILVCAGLIGIVGFLFPSPFSIAIILMLIPI